MRSMLIVKEANRTCSGSSVSIAVIDEVCLLFYEPNQSKQDRGKLHWKIIVFANVLEMMIFQSLSYCLFQAVFFCRLLGSE